MQPIAMEKLIVGLFVRGLGIGAGIAALITSALALF